ncbi:hypothetical protein BFW01_g8344 [Lasiodiplodia theobromae]|uniref:Transmembrane protein n=2 Tax=Lasiodiplodia TaxID=66739 RepID=A0A5N5DB89_9PEZI|nr:Transmembrane protein [Lasiodiplodia theobromae]KAB2575113.1 hypothetical protein DBV05_g6190 [Lasiodiplodia theobromae]KAF4538863.1 Transmembrane protein [Lasiodiplodia theobromae]KAF9637448.1 hypothetical protein BFW01_g8344 [Lasiodiplodia theobromae]KAK0647565.1 hypothetical protein DIS24_g7600 [Lasiodiplodia hormozganensis]
MYEIGFNDVPWFPNRAVQVGFTVGYLVTMPLISLMLFSRFPLIRTLREIYGWKLQYTRVTILIALFASWCYIFVGGLLNLGIGLSQSLKECSTGLFLCTWFYTTTKLGVYLFLMERAFVVRGGGVRLQSWHYRFNFFLMGCWLCVFVLLETGRIYALREDGVCTFGWEWWALIPLMSLDVFVNIYLVAMFVIPLFRDQFVNRKLRRLAIKSLWTSVGSVIATMVNLVMLIMIEAPGWLCLGSCSIDIFANAVLLFYMTMTQRKDDREAKSAWTLNGFHKVSRRASSSRMTSSQDTGPQEPAKDQWSSNIEAQNELIEYELNGTMPENPQIRNAVEAIQVPMKTASLGDNNSDRAILPHSNSRETRTVNFP